MQWIVQNGSERHTTLHNTQPTSLGYEIKLHEQSQVLDGDRLGSSVVELYFPAKQAGQSPSDIEKHMGCKITKGIVDVDGKESKVFMAAPEGQITKKKETNIDCGT